MHEASHPQTDTTETHHRTSTSHTPHHTPHHHTTDTHGNLAVPPDTAQHADHPACATGNANSSHASSIRHTNCTTATLAPFGLSLCLRWRPCSLAGRHTHPAGGVAWRLRRNRKTWQHTCVARVIACQHAACTIQGTANCDPSTRSHLVQLLLAGPGRMLRWGSYHGCIGLRGACTCTEGGGSREKSEETTVESTLCLLLRPRMISPGASTAPAAVV